MTWKHGMVAVIDRVRLVICAHVSLSIKSSSVYTSQIKILYRGLLRLIATVTDTLGTLCCIAFGP